MAKRPFPLYHWSPRERRNSILKHGLVPNKLSKDKEWRPPYICFSKTPSLAWSLSGMMSDIYGEWDLWMIWSSLVEYKTLNYLNSHHTIEYRIFHRVYKKDVWYVGSRINDPKYRRFVLI